MLPRCLVSHSAPRSAPRQGFWTHRQNDRYGRYQARRVDGGCPWDRHTPQAEPAQARKVPASSEPQSPATVTDSPALVNGSIKSGLVPSGRPHAAAKSRTLTARPTRRTRIAISNTWVDHASMRAGSLTDRKRVPDPYERSLCIALPPKAVLPDPHISTDPLAYRASHQGAIDRHVPGGSEATSALALVEPPRARGSSG